MTTVREGVYKPVLALLDIYTEDGTEVSEADNIDIEKKVILFTNMSQKEQYRENKTTKQLEILASPPVNQLGEYTNFDVVDYEDEIQYYPPQGGVTNVNGYSIQVDGDCTVTFEEMVTGAWVELDQVIAAGVTEITTFKGVLNTSSKLNQVRMKIEATSHFRHLNRALWKYKYEVTKVPTYEPYIEVVLPLDFHNMDEVVAEYEPMIYAQSIDYKIENNKSFFYDIFFKGTLKITYRFVPADITSLDDEVELDEIYMQNTIYDVVAKIGFYENQSLVNWAEGRRLEGKQDAKTDTPPSAEEAVNPYW